MDDFPRLRDALAPATYSLVLVDGAIEGDRDSGYLAAGLDACLVPPGVEPPQPGDEFERDTGCGKIELSLDTETSELRLSQIDLPRSDQTFGLGSLVFAQLVELGIDLGLESIHLEAGLVGRWAWMRCGCDFDFPEMRDSVIEVASWYAHQLGVEVDLGEVKHSWDLVDLPGTVTVEQVRAVGGQVSGPPEQTISLGKALVLGPPTESNLWWGRFELRRESTCYVRLQSYLQSRGLAYNQIDSQTDS